MTLVCVRVEAESTGMTTLAGFFAVWFVVPVVAASLTHPQKAQKARRVPAHMTEKIPGILFFFGMKRLISQNLGYL